MSSSPQGFLRGSVRALTGAAVLAAAAIAVVAVSTIPLPQIQTAALPVSVDVRPDVMHDVVCPGSFGVLGADSQRPTVAIPTGAADRTISGDPERTADLTPDESSGTNPSVFVTDASFAAAVAQTQMVDDYGVRGLVATACVTPVNEQWLVGGATTLGTTATLVLNNPTEVPATVRISVYDAEGQVDSERTSGVLVAEMSQRTVALNGYAPAQELLAVRVESSGAAVAAALNISAVNDLTPFAADTVTRQVAPATTLSVPGVANISDHVHGPGDAGELDRNSVRVRILAPDGASGIATAYAVDKAGQRTEIATLEYRDSQVAEQPVRAWPEGAEGVVIEAESPIVGGVLGSADKDGAHDYSWFAPAPELRAGQPVQIPVVNNGQLVLMNPSQDSVEVTVTTQPGSPKKVTLAAGAATPVSGSGSVTLESDAAVVAAVRVSTPAALASYPIVDIIERNEPFEVFTR